MNGIILVGSAGSRLRPLALMGSKQLQPVYDKPMACYPLTTLTGGGIREFCVIFTLQNMPRVERLPGDYATWGLQFEYRRQPKSVGAAQALLITEWFIGRNNVTLILGYNVFYGSENSYTAVVEFARTCLDLRKPHVPFGIYNVTNPGFISTWRVVKTVEEILRPIQEFDFLSGDEEFCRVAANTPRSNYVLDISKLAVTEVKIRPPIAAIEAPMRAWKPESKTAVRSYA